jgi:hypothetical protein
MTDDTHANDNQITSKKTPKKVPLLRGTLRGVKKPIMGFEVQRNDELR